MMPNDDKISESLLIEKREGERRRENNEQMVPWGR